MVAPAVPDALPDFIPYPPWYILLGDDPDHLDRLQSQLLPWISPPDYGATQRAITQVKGIFGRLPPHYEEVLRLHFLEDRRQEVIAEMLGISQPAVCYRVMRALRAARMAEALLPDLSPQEVYDRVLVAAESFPGVRKHAEWAHTAALYWTRWNLKQVAILRGEAQTTAYSRLKRMREDLPDEEIRHGLLIIQEHFQGTHVCRLKDAVR